MSKKLKQGKSTDLKIKGSVFETLVKYCIVEVTVMNLRAYLRKQWAEYIKAKIIMDKCEFCNSKENLHLYHIDKFHNSLMDTLEELSLPEE